MGFGIAPAALILMFLAGSSGGAAFSLIPYLCGENQIHARASGAVAPMGNLGSTLRPPLFAALMAPPGMLRLALPVVFLALPGIGLATWKTHLHQATA